MDDHTDIKVTSPVIVLNNFRAVWSIELPDLEDRANGKDPDSRLNKLNDGYHNIARKFGDSTSDNNEATFADNSKIKNLLGTLGVMTGTTGIVMGVLAGVAAFDLSDSFKLHGKIELTKSLLMLDGREVENVDWDICLSTIDHITTWLNPLLATRIASLTEIISLSNEAELPKQRLKLYTSAVEELVQTVNSLKNWSEHYAKLWEADRQEYQLYEDGLQSLYNEEKQRLKLANDALLINSGEFTLKSRELEDKYKLATCNVDGVINTCSHVRIPNSAYCFFHACYSPGCTEKAVKDKHYCTNHSRLSSQALITDQKPLTNEGTPESKDKSERKRALIFIGVLTVILLPFILPLGNRNSSLDGQPQLEPAPMVEVAPPPEPAPTEKEILSENAVIPENDSLPNKESVLNKEVDDLHGAKSDAEWTEEDMVKVVELLAKPQSAEDLAYLNENESFYSTTECSGSGCMIRKREFNAAKLLRDNKAANATEALGLEAK